MEFLEPKIEAYALKYTEAERDILAKLNRETHAKVMLPRMLSGHMQGRVLSMLSYMIKPVNILEIGTYTGYSALCMIEGMQPGGNLFTIDINEELETMVRNFFAQAGVADKIQYKIGNALEIIPSLDCMFDLVFIDADKINYSNYYDLVFDKVNTGGYIIADNVLWSGKVVEDKAKWDKDTAAINAYAEKVANDKRVQNVLFPIRDGLMISRKK